MRKVVWRAKALADLQHFREWLSTFPNAKPDHTLRRIRAAADTLARLGDIGRPSRATGAREFSVRGAPYVIAYQVTGNDIDILAVYHTAQERR